MKNNYKMLICLLMVLSIGCNSEWVNTEATITNVEKLGDHEFAYTIRYNVTESTVVNAEGQPIKGPIEQHGILKDEPVHEQKLKMRYMRDEPVIFELKEKINKLKNIKNDK